MNILHVSDIDVSSCGGGMNTVIPELIMRQLLYDSTLNETLFITRKKYKIAKQIPYFICFMEGNFLKYLQKSDLLVFHSVYNLKFILLYFFCKKNKLPYLIVSHGGLSKVALKKGMIKKKLFKFLFLNRFVKDATALCFTSLEEQLSSVYTDKKYIIVPNPIQISNYSYRLDVNNNDEVKMIFLSKIDFYYKGLDVLFDALNIIKEDIVNENVFLSFYGYGKNKEVDVENINSTEKDILKLILRIKELNIGERIKYCGPVFGHQKMEVLKNSDIYVLTSRSEAMPLSISEALSVGTPCLVTHGTNMSNLIEQYKAGWSSYLNKEDLAFNILKAIKEYKDSPVTFRKSARVLYEYNSSIDVGKVSIDQYKTILEEK